MADNLTTQSATPATVPSASVIATDDVAGVHYQRVKLVDGTLDGTGAIGGDATNGLDVDVTRVQGTVAVTGTFYQATQPVSGTVTTTPTGTQNVDVTANSAGLATSAKQDTLLAELQLKADLTETQPVSAVSLPLPTGAATALKQPAFSTAGTASTDVITVQGISGGTAQPVSGTVTVNGVPTTVGQKTRTTSLAVTLSSDDITSLTPASAITGFATSAIQTDGTQKSKVTDGTRDATVKAASTAAVAADTALVVAISPNNTLNVANAPIANMVKGVSTATGTSTTSLIAAIGTKQLAITSISVANTGTAASLITLQDGSAGTAMYVTMAPPGGGSNITLPTPIVTTAGNGLFFVCGTASTTINISASGYTV